MDSTIITTKPSDEMRHTPKSQNTKGLMLPPEIFDGECSMYHTLIA